MLLVRIDLSVPFQYFKKIKLKNKLNHKNDINPLDNRFGIFLLNATLSKKVFHDMRITFIKQTKKKDFSRLIRKLWFYLEKNETENLENS